MNLKLLICSLTMLSAGSAIAQDRIYKRNGEVLEGRIKEVGVKTVSYKKSDNPEGPNYVLNKADLDRIEYENGENEEFEMRGPRRPGMHSTMHSRKKSSKPYGNNIIAMSPMHITDNGLGLALTYERVLDKKNNMLSFYLPVVLAFSNDNYDNYYYGNYYGGPGDYSTLYIMPGIKFYPTGGKGIIKYSVGPNIGLVSSKYNHYEPIYDTWGNYAGSKQSTRNSFLAGMMITNAMNINPTPHLHMGLELGIGLAYYTNQRGWFNDMDNPKGMMQFGFKIGYRF